jgi:hypothetical protein
VRQTVFSISVVLREKFAQLQQSATEGSNWQCFCLLKHAELRYRTLDGFSYCWQQDQAALRFNNDGGKSQLRFAPEGSTRRTKATMRWSKHSERSALYAQPSISAICIQTICNRMCLRPS